MAKLHEIANLIRSKNAGPFMLTIDIMFPDEISYRRVTESGRINAAVIAETYGLAERDVTFFNVDNALAIKASFPRPAYQGDLGDADGHGGQQYAPLLFIEI